ncbi:hypothetical protein ACWEQC_22505 [Streptomyces shenzhenensis]
MAPTLISKIEAHMGLRPYVPRPTSWFTPPSSPDAIALGAPLASGCGSVEESLN